MSFWRHPINLLRIWGFINRISSYNPSNMHPMRLFFSLFYIISSIKVIISIYYFITVPFPIVNTSSLFSFFDIILIFKFRLWRIRNTQNLMIQIKTWIYNSDYSSLSFMSCFPGFRDSNNFITGDTVWLFFLSTLR